MTFINLRRNNLTVDIFPEQFYTFDSPEIIKTSYFVLAFLWTPWSPFLHPLESMDPVLKTPVTVYSKCLTQLNSNLTLTFHFSFFRKTQPRENNIMTTLTGYNCNSKTQNTSLSFNVKRQALTKSLITQSLNKVPSISANWAMLTHQTLTLLAVKKTALVEPFTVVREGEVCSFSIASVKQVLARSKQTEHRIQSKCLHILGKST